MDLADLLAISPPAPVDPAVAVAAARAGARGAVDLEFAAPADVGPAVARLSAYAPAGRWGGKVRTDVPGVADAVLAGPRPGWVLLAGPDHPERGELVARFRDLGAEVLVEAVTVGEATRAADLGADGVVLKGHEAGGRVGPDPAFVLVQKWLKAGRRRPFWVQGGIGPNTAAACAAAGARGVVLDSQLLLARESAAADDLRKRVGGLDGAETAVVGERVGEAYRAFARADGPAFADLARLEEAGEAGWSNAVRGRVAADPAAGLWLVGQDVALAAGLAAKFVTVAGILQAVADRAGKQAAAANRLRPLAEGAPLSVANGTKYPILQGPMTRVSDTAGFADAVAAGGGLPFLALALSRKPECEKLMADTKARLGGRPWGVGVLGFVPPDLRQEQLDAVRSARPPFAVIAGGRADQAKELEALGIKTYLHVPSPGLLRLFLKDGATRFVFEGRECGGHVGPRTSFALWEAAVAVIEEHLASHPKAELDVAFAGGVHDGVSGGMVSALAAGLADKGVRVGAWVGTAYLFTEEAVATGAITARFQKEALGCDATVLLETGPGHAVRCVPTPYTQAFEAEKRRLRAAGKSAAEVGLALERMNLGRLRVASKGVDRAAGADGSGLVAVPEDEQHQRGMYMIGQVAALRDSITTVAALHADISAGLPAGEAAAVVPAAPRAAAPRAAEPPCDVAVIGLACFYPKAGGLRQYWENVLGKVNAVVEVPATHWDWKLYYDPDPKARDKMVSKWGGFMDDVVFEPLRFGITPKSIPNIEPLQLLLLEAVRQAFADAGYDRRPFDRERAAAVLGVGGGGMPLSVAYGFRACMPLLDTIPGVPIKSKEIVELGDGILPEWTEDSFPGILLNVAAGRVANRFDLGGPNMAIDAACGSSLAALHAGVRELTTGTSDLAVVMGADAVQTPYAYVAFSKTHALSPRGRCRPFDAGADGIALAEGVGVAVLKRLADAERDGDRIYAVVKGVGASSDGRDKGLTAPRAEGQLRALERAYAQARVSPARVGLVEAHGTGTVVGDRTEARAIGQLLRDAGAAPRATALGSVKSMIGHAKCAAGLAGLIKAAFALHHKVLPPTLAEAPNPNADLDAGPLYLNTDARPWVHGSAHPRTAGVSAFGFGGTNFHAVLEEYRGDFLDRPACGLRDWPAELVVLRRPDVTALVTAVRHCRGALAAGAAPHLAELAAAAWRSSKPHAGGPTLAVVATSLADLTDKLDAALTTIPAGGRHADPRGVYFAAAPGEPGKVAFLFPGQGSQYPDMLAQAGMAFPEVRAAFDAAERALLGQFDRPLGRFVYPPSAFTPEQEAANRKELQRTEVAQPALGAAGLGMARLLASLGVEPDVLAGHSYGEYVALSVAGGLGADALIRLSHRRGEVIRAAAGAAAGGMLAVEAAAGAVAAAVNGVPGVWVANHNSPAQTVLAGTDAGLSQAADKLAAAGLRAQRIPVACGFHSPLIAGAREPLAAALAEAGVGVPRKPVYANTTAAPHPADAGLIARRLADHLASPVRFRDQVEAMYAAGARVFVEVGPAAVLTGLVGQTLGGQPHLAAASDVKGRPGLVQLAHLLGQLLAHGVPARLDRLFQGRDLAAFDLASLPAAAGKAAPAATAWVVNGVRSRPVNGPEPRLLGHPLPEHGGPPAPPRKSAPVAPAAKPAAPKVPAPVPLPAPEPRRAPMTPPDPTPAPSANGHHRAAPPSPAAADVMARFQDVMARFLDTQRAVMLSYLGAGGQSAPTLPHAAPLANDHAPLPSVPPMPPPALPVTANGHHPAPPAAPVVPPAIANRLASAPMPHANGQPAAPAPTPVAVPAPAPVAVTTPGQSAAPAKLDRDSLLARLLDLVSERTGYPKESLSIDLDLEADLGIDSIKRVEILGTLADGLPQGADGKGPALEMEKLSVLKTLRGIADYVAEAIGGADGSPAAIPAVAAPAPAPTVVPKADAHPGAAALARGSLRRGDIQRLTVKLVDAPLPARPVLAAPTGTVVVTDDGLGTAREFADRLAELDIPAVLVRHGSPADGPFAADLTDPAAVAGLVADVREKCGPVAGLVHLLPLAEPPEGEAPARRARREVKSLYLLARGLEADIRAAGKAGPAVLLAVTGMGGHMGYGDPLPAGFFAGHGGVAGFAKSLGHEWPEVAVRVVDVDPECPAPAVADALLAELGDPDGPFEVGHHGDRRVTWQCEPAPLTGAGDAAPRLGPDDVVLVTGGARGITAKVAEELGRRHRCKLVLVGRSAEPGPEAADTAGLSTPAEIKSVLLKRSPGAKPAAVEAAYRRLVQDREIRSNLAAVRATGAEVVYRSADVADPAAVAALVAEFGFTAVVHGAGVIDDKLLRDKTPESFERVFGTKVDSALALARALDPAKVKAFALFASVTSRYGNRGQADYAAANEVLSKLACQLDRAWPGRVAAVAWGPWAEVGMVADLEKHLVGRGLLLIPPAVGARLAADELALGPKGEPEVVIAGGTELPAGRPRALAEASS